MARRRLFGAVPNPRRLSTHNGRTKPTTLSPVLSG